MVEAREPMPDEQREVRIDDEVDLEVAPPAPDQDEKVEVEDEVDEAAERSRDEARETGQIIPDDLT